MAPAATTMQAGGVHLSTITVEAKPAESSTAVVFAAERAKVVAAVPDQATQPAANSANSATKGQVATLHRRQQTDVSTRRKPSCCLCASRRLRTKRTRCVSCLCLPLPFSAPLVTLPSMPRLSIAVQTVTMHELTFTMAPRLVAPKLLASRFAVQIVITHNTFCTSTKTDCIESASSTFLNNVVAQEETFLEIPKSHQH